ncbi:hypothetical protein ER70_08290 (plasmid) [Borreliella bissettiae]|uniref:Lipoprotein n=1 Tax=Borrelia bissettiae TaxID=64897 RepID=A0A1L8Z9U9_BORBI|nr:hypothetical protein [Borreliella bissettiae]OJH14521.1 hypothetical protein ER70_08290 [Borreliella bissettiae]
MKKLSILIILLVFSCKLNQDISSSIPNIKEEIPESQIDESQTDRYSSYNKYLNYNKYSFYYRRTPRITKYRYSHRYH